MKKHKYFVRVIKCIPLTIVLFFCLSTFAQKKITGVVTGYDGLPVAGANVILKNTNLATVTLADGSFTITANTGDVLEISFVGYKMEQVKIGNETNLKISLTESVVQLDDLVVTGYTSQKVKEITGSVSVVKPKDLIAVPAGQVEQMLQGRVAGLNIITSGEPGSASNVRLHGIGNFGDVTPLYIIDGVQGDINSLNPYDIESIQVLKDASAYSIYGVRGANGVIIVTTKKGKTGRTKVSYDFYIGSTRPLKNGLDELSPQENADLLWMALRNSGQVGSNGNPSYPLYGNGTNPVLPDYLFAGPYRGLFEGDPRADKSLYNIDANAGQIYQIVRFNKQGTDWFHKLFQPAISQSHSLNVSGGNEKNKYLFSLGYLDQQGTLINSYLRRYTARINTEFSITNSIRVGENLQVNYTQFPPSRNLNSGLIGYGFRVDPYLPVFDINSSWSSYGYPYSGPTTDNPVGYRTLLKDDKRQNWQNTGNVYGEIDFLKNFSFRTSIGGFINNFYSLQYNYGTYQPPSTGPNNKLTEQSGYSRSLVWTNLINYKQTFRNKHTIKILAGTEQINNYNREQQSSRQGFYTDDPYYRLLFNGNPQTQTNTSSATATSIFSFLSKADYGYKEKYFISGTLRRDGSSVFGPDRRYGWFPSVGVAWRMTEETFLKTVDWLTELKLRASWGKTGFAGNTDPLNQYSLYGGGPGDAYYDINGISAGSIQQGFRLVRFGNARTSWQEDVVNNIGLETILWKGRLNVTADWYTKKTTGLLFPIALPGILGVVTPPNVNVGNINNKGIDLLIGSKGNFSKNWKWDATLTFSKYDNKIIKLNEVPFFDDVIANFGNLVRNEVGYPVGSFFGYKIIGLFRDAADVSKSPIQDAAAPGRFKYLDANGDGVITDEDRIHFGNPNPKFTLGLNLSIQSKSFDFTTFFYGSIGNDVLNDLRYMMDIFPSTLFLTPKSKTALYNSWTPSQPDAKAPVVENNPNFSNSQVTNSYRLEKGTYFTNKSMILGYTFPKSWIQKCRIEKARIYIQVLNFFTFTNYKGLDPELPGSSSAFGIDYGKYPNNEKQYLVGLNIDF